MSSPPGDRHPEQRRAIHQPVVVGAAEQPLSHRRQGRYQAQHQQRVTGHADVGDHAPESGLGRRPQALHRRNRGEHEGQQRHQAHERQVANAGAGDQCHDQKDREVDHAGSHVRLQQDQSHRCGNYQQGQEEARQLRDAVADLRQVRRQEQDRRQLGELGGLDSQVADAQPRTRPVHLPAQQQGKHQQRQCPQEDIGRTRLVLLVVVDREQRQQHAAAARPDNLLEPLIRHRLAGRVDAAGVDEQDADGHQCQARQEQNRIQRTQAATASHCAALPIHVSGLAPDSPPVDSATADSLSSATADSLPSSGASSCSGLNTASPYHGLR